MSDASAALPPATFEFLVFSLRAEAEMHYSEKTRGRLTIEEQRLLDNSLTELRFRYVQAASPAS